MKVKKDKTIKLPNDLTIPVDIYYNTEDQIGWLDEVGLYEAAALIVHYNDEEFAELLLDSIKYGLKEKIIKIKNNKIKYLKDLWKI